MAPEITEITPESAESVAVVLRGLFPGMHLPPTPVIRERLPGLLANEDTPAPAPSTTNETELLDVPAVLATLHVSRPTLWRLIRDRKLVPTRIGRRVLVCRTDLEKLIKHSRMPMPKNKRTAPGADAVATQGAEQ